MRVIKFRGWDEIAKVMHYDVNFIRSGIEGNDWVIFISDKRPLSSKHHPFEDPFFQQQIKIMQFTGLTDANGVEIYEGDIVSGKSIQFGDIQQTVNFSEYVDNEEYVHEIHTGWNVGGIPLADLVKDGVFVIGNIYQNYQLLESNNV